MNLDQILSLARTLLSATGPVAGLSIIYGYPQDKTALWLGVATGIVPPAISAVWGIFNKTDAAKVTTASNVPGVEVKIDPSASMAVRSVAYDPSVPNVSTK